MSTFSTTSHAQQSEGAGRPWGRIIGLAAAVGTLPVFAVTTLTGNSGAEITAGLVDDKLVLTLGTMLAVLVSAGLLVAAARLGRSVPGDTGTVIALSGAAVALMYAGYYAVFGAGAVVATEALADPGAGLGEASSLVLNVMEIARFGPGLALVAAAVAAGRFLPRGVRIAAGVRVLMTLVPLTSWVAALLIPLWLGVAAALVPARD